MPIDGIIVGESDGRSDQEVLVPWWSFTKTVLAAAALVLVGRRRLKLDEQVNGKPYTLRHLLQHTSGLPDYGGLPEYHAAVAAGEPPWPIDELLLRVNATCLVFPPASSFAYSNVGYLLVRQIIEKATATSLDEAIRFLVCEPLGIERVVIATKIHDLDNTAWGNARRYHPGWVYHGLLIGPPSAAGSLLDRLLNSDFLPPHLLNEMFQPVSVGGPFPDRPAVAPSYGLGLMIDEQSPLGRVVGHTGQGPGSTSAVYSFPDLRPRRTLACFAPVDTSAALGTLELHLQTLAANSR